MRAEVHIFLRECGIVELPQDRSNIPDALLLVPLIDVIEEVLLDTDRIDHSFGSDSLRQRPGEKACSRPDIGDDHFQLQLKPGDDVIDFLIRDPVWALQCFEPIVRLSGSQLGDVAKAQARPRKLVRFASDK